MKDVSDIGGRRQRDFDDLQNEISGADVGRIRRFLSPEDGRSPDGRRKKAERERTLRTLTELMRDPEYAALYLDLGDKLRDAEVQADTTLAALQRQLSDLTRGIDVMEAGAARDPNGRIVFRYADGRVVYADKTSVPDHLADGVIWPKDAPSAEDYFALVELHTGLVQQLEDWSVYRNHVLGDIRHRYDDEEQPMDEDDLRRALEAIEQLNPEAASVSVAAPTAKLPTPVQVTSNLIPTSLK